MAPVLQFAALAATAFAAPALVDRALPSSPNGYTPTEVDCPSNRPSVRLANGLSDSEKNWVETRRKATVTPMTNLLGSLNISGFDAGAYIKDQSGDIKNLPNIALAFSGGGYRAMLTGAGALKAFDSRETTTSGGLGGLLQSSTYVGGLSGGGWMVGSIFVNNFTRVSDIQSSTLWNLTGSLFTSGGPGFLAGLAKQVNGKDQAGFEVSAVDYWGRALSNQFFNATSGGPEYTWSSIRDQPGFSTGDIPFPLVVADKRVNKEKTLSSLNTTVYEFTPFELGSWDPTTYGFLDLQYLGSEFDNGKLANDAKCVRGYDNAGLVIGTTSAYYSKDIVLAASAGILFGTSSGPVAEVISEIASDGGLVSYFEPNPYKNWNPTGKNEEPDLDTLYLVDGGTDGQNLPLQPFIQPARAVDVIVAVDSSNDNGTKLPNGQALLETYKRSQDNSIANGTAFPKIPDTNTFYNLGFNSRPAFFGCNDTNTPLVVYIPNTPYTFLSNTDTIKTTYSYADRDAMIENGALAATQGNGTANQEFRACLGCAVLARSFKRTNTNIPPACQTCFNSYCWNGTVVDSTVSVLSTPTLLGASPVGKGLNVTGSSGSSGSSGSNNSGGGGSSNNKPNSAGRVQGAGAALLAALAAAAVLL